ncbi:MAG: RNA 2',3'-cyclic phosphodiesterase [Acidimicrobiales bacterium]
MRLFIAAWPPPEVRAVLATLRGPDHPAVRWTAPDRWHVTLRFLGEVGEDVLARARVAADLVGERQPAPRALLGPSTVLLGGVLVAPVSGLDGVAGDLAETTRALGAAPANRPFGGHVTLARGRGRRRIPNRLAHQAVDTGWRVGALTLVRSLTGPAGQRYDVLETVELRGAAPA